MGTLLKATRIALENYFRFRFTNASAIGDSLIWQLMGRHAPRTEALPPPSRPRSLVRFDLLSSAVWRWRWHCSVHQWDGGLDATLVLSFVGRM